MLHIAVTRHGNCGGDGDAVDARLVDELERFGLTGEPSAVPSRHRPRPGRAIPDDGFFDLDGMAGAFPLDGARATVGLDEVDLDVVAGHVPARHLEHLVFGAGEHRHDLRARPAAGGVLSPRLVTHDHVLQVLADAVASVHFGREATIQPVAERASQSEKRRKLFVWADEIGLEREERLAIASYLLRRDITSWKQLDDAQVDRLLDALEGHHLVSELLSQRIVPARPERPPSATAEQ